MALTHNTVTRLRIQDADGDAKGFTGPTGPTYDVTGRVRLVAAGGMVIADKDGEIEFSSDLSAAASDPDLLAVYLGYEGTGPSAPHVVTHLAEAGALPSGDISLLGGPCGQVGLFTTQYPLASGKYLPSATAADLTVTDLCAACTDCEDYEQAYARITLLYDWITRNHHLNFLDATGDPDVANDELYPPSSRLFRQYQAMLAYWNYLVMAQSLILLVKQDGTSAVIRFGFYNAACDIENPRFVLDVLMDNSQ
jgi:hypothetical protein